MNGPSILVVEDNATTSKMMRVALQSEGYSVVEAADGRSALEHIESHPPDLIIQDLVLPDLDGLQLAQRIRALPGGSKIPLIALSGFSQRLDDARAHAAAFDSYLVKPVELPTLMKLINDYLSALRSEPDKLGVGRRLIIADDDPIQLKLAGLQFSSLGFDVVTANSGQDALRAARKSPPDAILSDVLMPGLDGFELCLEVRRDPTLSAVRVVLISSHYKTELDHALAKRVGANGLLSKVDGFPRLAHRVLDCMEAPSAVSKALPADLQREHTARLLAQLERQREENAELTQRCSFQAAELAVLGAVVEALAGQRGHEQTLQSALAACLDAAVVSQGALYLRSAEGALELRHVIGIPADGDAASFFGQMSLLENVATDLKVLALPSRWVPASASSAVLEGARVQSGLIVPVASQGRQLGALFLGSATGEMTSSDVAAFWRTMGHQLGQTVALATAFGRTVARYRSLMENASCAFFTQGLDGAILDVNRRAEELLGRGRDAIVGRRLTDFTSPDGQGKAAASFSAALAGAEQAPEELELCRSDEMLRQVTCSSSLVEWDRSKVVLSVVSDMTELKAVQGQLVHAQKMEAIGRLAGGIAHDFNNMLTVIMNFAGFARDGLPDQDPRSQDMAEVLRASELAQRLTSQLLAICRRQRVEPRLTSLNDVVLSTEHLLRRTIGEHIELVCSLSEDLWPVLVDPGHLEQVVMNLAVNARDAMPEGGRLTIETRNIEADGGLGQVLMSVADTGLGMDGHTKANLFQPFFTTKEIGKGTGLGLATVFGLVSQANGTISVHSEVGEGARFEILLPKAHGSVSPFPSRAPGASHRGTETLLVVEDEPKIRQAAQRILTEAGYSVMCPSNIREALALVDAQGGAIHLLLVDVIMPEMNGVRFAEVMREKRPGARILFMSGYTDDAVSSTNLPGIEVFRKPFTSESLLNRVRLALDE